MAKAEAWARGPRWLIVATCVVALLGVAVFVGRSVAQGPPVRVALIISNQAYAEAVGVLVNPHNDAALVRAALEEHGFDVTHVSDARRGEVFAAVRAYARALRAGGAEAQGVLYYVGHGAAPADSARNYLIPVSALDASSEALWDDSVPLDEIRRILVEAAPQAAQLVVFDACREELNLPGRNLGGGESRGFEQEPEPWGDILLAFSTGPNRLASDGDAAEGAGPYALELVAALRRARLGDRPVRALELIADVSRRVAERRPQQRPRFNGGAGRPLVFEPAPEIAEGEGEGDEGGGRAEAGARTPPTETSRSANVAEVEVALRMAEATGDWRVFAALAERFAGTFAEDIFRARAESLRGELTAAEAIRREQLARQQRAEAAEQASLTQQALGYESLIRAQSLELARGREADAQLARLTTEQLVRVGLLSDAAAVDDIWTDAEAAALRRFETYAGLEVDGEPSPGALAMLGYVTTTDLSAALDAARERLVDAGSDQRLLIPERYAAFFAPAGQLTSGSGAQGGAVGALTNIVFVRGMRFPIESAPAYANSQVYGAGGFRGPTGGQCASVNYSYPWRDNFCESRRHQLPACPGGRGHQGVDLRPATCDAQTHWAVAAADGVIASVGSYTITLLSDEGFEHRYGMIRLESLQVSAGDRVRRGQRIGQVSNNFGGTPTTIHLHYEIRAPARGGGRSRRVLLPPYTSLVASYVRLLDGEEPPFEPELEREPESSAGE